jgi:hypothetical protein
MRLGAKALMGAVALVGLAVVPPGAHAGGVRFSYRFDARTVGTPTAGHVHVVFPTDSRGRPRQLRGLDFRFPTGTRIDRSVAPRCTAGDEEIQQRGAEACPADTQVGHGSATAWTGFGPPVDPFRTDAHTFNTRRGTVNVFTPRGMPGPTLYRTRQRYDGLWVRDSFPPPPAGWPPPNGKSLPLEARFTLDRRAGRRSWLTTPSRCPARGRWTGRIVLTFASGARRSAVATTPCRPGHGR